MVEKKKQVVKKTTSNKERLERSISENQIKILAEKIFKTEVAEDVTDILKETRGMLQRIQVLDGNIFRNSNNAQSYFRATFIVGIVSILLNLLLRVV